MADQEQRNAALEAWCIKRNVWITGRLNESEVRMIATQYAAEQVAAERTRIADELEQIVWATNSDLRHKTIGDACDANGDECLVCDVNDKVAAFYEQLRGADNDGTK